MDVGAKPVLIRWVEVASSGYPRVRKYFITSQFWNLGEGNVLEWGGGGPKRTRVSVLAQLPAVCLWASYIPSCLDLPIGLDEREVVGCWWTLVQLWPLCRLL